LELQSILFWIFSLLGIAGAIGLILNRNPVYSALNLILNFFSIAGLYLTLQAEFLSVIQILVYAGAIMVLFLFVIMLLNLSDEPKESPFTLTRVAAYVLGIAFVVEMFIALSGLGYSGQILEQPFSFASTESIGALMMTEYLFPFEMISVVLIAALIGAIVVAKKYNYENKND
jgi:NADH-quinone oxidoreductase subunit J